MQSAISNLQGGSVSQVRVVTDGDAHLDPDLAHELNITVVPLTVQIEGEVYQDENGARNEGLLARMARDRSRPAIVGPTTADFRRVYQHLTRTTDRILSIHTSARLSPVFRNARTAADAFLGRCDITVMDSQSTSLGLGILAREAAKMARAGYSLGEVVRHIRGMISRIYVVMFTDSLDYLERSGRISKSQCILGTMLGIKPFLAIEDGEIIPMEKVRSREKGLDKLAEFAGEFTRIEEMAILQSTSYPTSETLLLRERLESSFPGKGFPILVYGPMLAYHVGPDGLGLVTYEGFEERESL
ncbi:MAG TPA: DegV family protein [Anaerolineales bacterium]|nr:DegV family protein [Anaerolineales bacterium]